MDFARNERGFCVGFAWNLILFSFMREREGYKHRADCTVLIGHCDLISRFSDFALYLETQLVYFHTFFRL